MKIKIVMFMVATLLGLVACSNSPENLGKPTITSFTWKTTGGGNILFDIKPLRNAYNITIQMYSYKKMVVKIPLTVKEDRSTFSFVNSVFSGAKDIRDYTFIPSGAPTGSWTSITLTYSDGKTQTISNIKKERELANLLKLVEEKLGSGVARMEFTKYGER